MFGPDGGQLASYWKIHLFEAQGVLLVSSSCVPGEQTWGVLPAALFVLGRLQSGSLLKRQVGIVVGRAEFYKPLARG